MDHSIPPPPLHHTLYLAYYINVDWARIGYQRIDKTVLYNRVLSIR